MKLWRTREWVLGAKSEPISKKVTAKVCYLYWNSVFSYLKRFWILINYCYSIVLKLLIILFTFKVQSLKWVLIPFINCGFSYSLFQIFCFLNSRLYQLYFLTISSFSNHLNKFYFLFMSTFLWVFDEGNVEFLHSCTLGFFCMYHHLELFEEVRKRITIVGLRLW